MFQIKALANTDTGTWPDEFVKLYLNNYLAGQENEACIGEVVVIKAQDSNKDIDTNLCCISIPDNIGLSQTANLPAKLKLCVGARVMLTDNVSVSDRLINGSLGTIKQLDRRSKPLCSTIYVKFNDLKAGNSLKDRRLPLQITARSKKFPLKKGKSTVIAERKQFPSILGHASTVHKFQGSTLTYMQGDLKSIYWQENCNWEELSTAYTSGSILYLTFTC